MQVTDSRAANKHPQATPLTPDTQKTHALSFGDILDTINPLQHIPVVSSVYRGMTGDSISQSARLVGDGIYGGVVGAASAVVNIISENITGKDIAANMIDSVGSDTSKTIYQGQNATALVADNTMAADLNSIATPQSTKLPSTAETNKNFFEFSKEKKEQQVSNLGLDNEGIRTQLMGQLDETLYNKL